MENKNKSLIGGIVATALAIALLESGAIQLSGSFLYGDDNDISLILKKGDDTFIIEPGEKIIINDADPVIYAFWWSVKNDTEKLIEKIKATPVNMDVWHEQREIIQKADTKNLTQLGFSTFFLNRTNRSGIIKGGVIGGQKQDGKYKIDARYNKEGLISRIEEISKLKSKIEIHNKDAMDLLSSKEVTIDNNTLVYFDPPYYQKGAQLYKNHYLPEDHKHIAEAVRNISTPWIVTYDNCDEIKNLYKQEKKVEFSLHYSTHIKRPKEKEVLFYGNLHLKSLPSLKR